MQFSNFYRAATVATISKLISNFCLHENAVNFTNIDGTLLVSQLSSKFMYFVVIHAIQYTVNWLLYKQ